MVKQRRCAAEQPSGLLWSAGWLLEGCRQWHQATTCDGDQCMLQLHHVVVIAMCAGDCGLRSSAPACPAALLVHSVGCCCVSEWVVVLVG